MNASNRDGFVAAEPASDGFPEGLLDQPFYGWVECRIAPTTSPKRAGLLTLRESRVNAARFSQIDKFP
jgi:hypothetical protein